MMTLGQSARYHGKVGALTLLSGALSIHGPTAARALAEGAADGLGQWLIRAVGEGAAYEILQQAADNVADEIVGTARTVVGRDRGARFEARFKRTE
jgi:hypothetical protein